MITIDGGMVARAGAPGGPVDHERDAAIGQ